MIKKQCHIGKVTLCCLMVESYTNDLRHFRMLAKEARKDFPRLRDKDIKIVYRGAPRGTLKYRIHFSITSRVPDSYARMPSHAFGE